MDNKEAVLLCNFNQNKKMEHAKDKIDEKKNKVENEINKHEDSKVFKYLFQLTGVLSDTVAAAGAAIQGVVAKTAELNEKYQVILNYIKVTDKVKASAQAVVDKAKDINDEYKVTEKIEGATNAIKNKVQEINEKYKITDKMEKVI